jgi:hypothetical protein
MFMNTNANTDLTQIRAAAQQLHAVISDAAAKRGGIVKADLEAAGQKAKSVADSIKASIGAQNDAVKKQLAEAVSGLQAVQKHAGEALKSSGEAFEKSIRQTLADARVSVQKISEAVAAKRSAHPQATHK